MPTCAIVTCRARSQATSVAKQGISYHRFPKEPEIKEKWLDATGRENWFPTKLSTICSKHFTANDYDIKKSGYKYLIPGAVPSVEISIDTSVPSTSSVVGNSKVTQSLKRKQSEITYDPDSDTKGIKLQLHDPTCPSSSTSVVGSSDGTELFRRKQSTSTSDFHNNAKRIKLQENVFSCPNPNASTPRKNNFKAIILTKESIIKRQRKQIKRIQAQNRRLKKKVIKIGAVMSENEGKFSMRKLRNEDISTLKITNLKADSVSSQQSGGGEGVPVQPPAPAPEVKPVDPVKAEPAEENVDVKPEPVPEVKPAENVVAPIPAEAAPKVPEAEIKAEVKTEVESEIVAEIDSKAVENAPQVEAPVTAEAPVATAVPVAVEAPVPAEVKEEKLPEVRQDDLSNGDAGGTSDWQQAESALLQKIQELETFKNEKSEDSLKMQIKVKLEEVDLLKARVKNLETELQAAISKPGAKNHEMIENIKQQHEELLSKARGMIFDKTKMVKNQELQIEALTTQVQSLKDINLITKDLLEIRNSEIKAMEDRLLAMEARFKTEKERFSLVLERAQTSSNINDDLKQEYMTQLKIFKELRLKYEQKVEALVAENNKLKLDLAKNGSGPSAAAPQ